MSAIPPIIPDSPQAMKLRPCVICVASGKGGVGKTSIALSLASQISKAARVLVIDLDYFNRGATGLLIGRMILKQNGETFIDVLLNSDEGRGATPVHVKVDAVENAPNLLFAGCSELTESAMRRLEDLNLEDISKRLTKLLRCLAEQLGVSCIVLDAHGGPDALSFAAASGSNLTVLVSDPDKVTLYGTLNFVARLREALPANAPRPHLKLLFNRVSKKFSWRGLTQIYDENLADLFDGPLLGAVPFLPSVFDNFASAPFVATLFPKSLFANKIRLLSRELLQETWPALVQPQVRAWPLWRVKLIRESVQDNSWARPFPITTTWLLVFFCAFVATLVVAIHPEDSLLTNALLYGGGGAAILLTLFAIINSTRLFLQSTATSYRFKVHTAMAGLYRWKLFLTVFPLLLFSIMLFAGLLFLLPALTNAKAKAQRIQCMNYLKQIGLSFRVWEGDNNDQFPFNVGTNAGGTFEFRSVDSNGVDQNGYLHFQVMSNELDTPKILVCPADPGRKAAMSFSLLEPTNVTYLMRSGTNLNDSHPLEILCYCPIHNLLVLCDGSVVSVKAYTSMTNQ